MPDEQQAAAAALPRVRVKICGITREEDARLAVRLGADALGFNFFRGSKRFLDPASAPVWIKRLPPFVTRVGVFVDPTEEVVEQVLEAGLVDALQFHGSESAGFCRRWASRGLQVIKAIGVRDASSLAAVEEYLDLAAILFDAWDPVSHGGTGRTIDWGLAREFVEKHAGVPVVLSGGLESENVDAAVRQVRPYGVDVASGVEAGIPGRKDPEKLRAFLKAVYSAF